MVQSLQQSKSFRILFNSPELGEEQRSGFHRFLKHGIAEELAKISFLEVKREHVNIEVFLDATTFQLVAPDDNSRNCILKMKTYACKLYVQSKIVWKKKSGEILMQTEPEWVLLAHLPMMTRRGHFVINGSPRVIVHQVVRAPGVYFQRFRKVKKDPRNKARFYGDIIPRKGAWVRLQLSKKGKVEIKLKKGPKVQAEMVERSLAVIEKQEFYKSNGVRPVELRSTSKFERFFHKVSHKSLERNSSYTQNSNFCVGLPELKPLKNRRACSNSSKARVLQLLCVKQSLVLLGLAKPNHCKTWSTSTVRTKAFVPRRGNQSGALVRRFCTVGANSATLSYRFNDSLAHFLRPLTKASLWLWLYKSCPFLFKRGRASRTRALLELDGFVKAPRTRGYLELELRLRQTTVNTEGFASGYLTPVQTLLKPDFALRAMLSCRVFKVGSLFKNSAELSFAMVGYGKRSDGGPHRFQSRTFVIRALDKTANFTRAQLKGDHRAFADVCDNLCRPLEPKEQPYPRNIDKKSLDMFMESKRDYAYEDIFATFKAPWRYNLGEVGREKLNKKFGLSVTDNQLTSLDVQAARNWLYRLLNGKEIIDDIDHSQNRRVRQSGELIQNQFENGVTRLRKFVRRKLRTPTFESFPFLKVEQSRGITKPEDAVGQPLKRKKRKRKGSAAQTRAKLELGSARRLTKQTLERSPVGATLLPNPNPVREVKSILFSRVNLWKIHGSLCFCALDKPQQIPEWQLRINSKRTPFNSFIPDLSRTDRPGSLSKAWQRTLSDPLTELRSTKPKASKTDPLRGSVLLERSSGYTQNSNLCIGLPEQNRARTTYDGSGRLPLTFASQKLGAASVLSDLWSLRRFCYGLAHFSRAPLTFTFIRGYLEDHLELRLRRNSKWSSRYPLMKVKVKVKVKVKGKVKGVRKARVATVNSNTNTKDFAKQSLLKPDFALRNGGTKLEQSRPEPRTKSSILLSVVMARSSKVRSCRVSKQASELFSTKPINGALREFFGSNPLSQYMDQTNPLAEITHKRRISSLGIGGVSRESAGMAIRGIHPTHYGRICPIETPEGKNAGLVNSLALYARINNHGFIETPYYKVVKGIVQEELGFSFYSARKETGDGLHLAPGDLHQSQGNMLGTLTGLLTELRSTKPKPKVLFGNRAKPLQNRLTRAKLEFAKLCPPRGGSFCIAGAVELAAPFVQADISNSRCLVPVRVADTLLDGFKKVSPDEVDCIGISPVQILSVATSLIPFLEHNDANRALMGSNMQRQAVPLMIPERPIVGTGLETVIAAESGQLIQSSLSGIVSHVSANKIIIERLFNTVSESTSNRAPLYKTCSEVLHWSTVRQPSTNSFNFNFHNFYNFHNFHNFYNFHNFHNFHKRVPRGPLPLPLPLPLPFRVREALKKGAKAKKPKNRALLSELGGLYIYKSIYKSRPCQASPSVCEGSAAQTRAKLELGSAAQTVQRSRSLRVLGLPNLREMALLPFVHSLRSFGRSNQETCLTQKPLVQEGEWVQKGAILTDCSASEKGELAVGKNVLIAYLPWEGYNFEDAIVVSDRLTKEQIYASLHIERYICEAQDVKEKMTTSNEWFTRNLPGVHPKVVSHLDRFGFPKIGTILKGGDILVGKIRYFRNKPTTPYEKLLSDILGTRYFSISRTSLRVPKGVHEARVITRRVVKTFQSPLDNTDTGVSRPAGTAKMVHIFLGEKRSIQIGDKMSGRHGNKGIISTILPKQDMPYLPNGTPIDILLNPLGVPSRMNVGQIFESLLGLASTYLNQNFKITAFDEVYGVEASQSLVYLKLYQARLQSGQNWLFQINFPGKTRLTDGRSGECFDQWVTVGRAYMLKLIHMVNEKIHARSVGPYALVTQQPLRGRSHKGGQRLGEMEVWALEGYGAAYTLQELLTKKSDDFVGRQEILDSLVVRPDNLSDPDHPNSYKDPRKYFTDFIKPDDPSRGFTDRKNPYQILQGSKVVLGHPEIFKTLICELQALCLDVGVYSLKKESFQENYLQLVN